jgi:hypothetical protein
MDPQLQAHAEQFRRRVAKAIEERSGAEATEDIVKLHMSTVSSIEARRAQSEQEASQAAADMRTRYDMLQQAHSSVSNGLLHIATQAAEISRMRGILESVQHMAERADNGMVPQENLLGVLTAVPVQPVHVPTVTAFSASDRFRSGFFQSPAGDVHLTLPFLGYSLVDYGPSAAGIIEATFLMQSRALPYSFIERETGMRLERMLPTVHQVSA